MYPFPLHHPHDRQSQVDLDNPDLTKFPKFKDAKGVEGIVNPGDVLYLPPYWWHHVISIDQTVSVNFWFEMKQTQATALKFPLSDSHKVAARRNIEKLVGEIIPSKEIGEFLHEIADGRFDYVK